MRYENDLIYRSKIEGRVKSGLEKILMIARPGIYIPYDVQKCFRKTNISIAEMFPKLNASAVKEDPDLDYAAIRKYRKEIMEECLDENGIFFIA